MTMIKQIGICVSLLFTFSLAAEANLIAYEGFDTTAANGTKVSVAGVTGSGFGGYGGDPVTNFRMLIHDGLSYQDSNNQVLTVTGKAGGMAAFVSGTQNLQLSLSSTLGNSGTFYTSFLLDITDVTSFGVMVGLQDSAVASGASPTASLEAAFRSTSSNYGIYADAIGIDERTGPATGTGGFLVISELNMDDEVMTTWLNPSDLANVSASATHTISEGATGTWDDMTSFIFSLGGQEAGTVDEIRIGETLADVVPYTVIPEPSSLVLGLLGVVLVAGVRRLRGHR